ncbi:alpha-N-acetyl-neuraminyl-2,3-beta-galactosyl-1,3-N-acetyl-galactosaminide alpha-2,6-sialyltransferase-like [Branchiostoma floridae x Branchiostoma belcheri]
MSLSRVPRRVWLVASLSGLGLILLVADRSSVFRSKTVPMTFPPPNLMERQKDANKFTKIPFSGPDFPDSPGHVGKPEPTSHIHPESPFPVPDHSHPVKLDTALRNMTENPSSHKQQSGPVAFDLADPLRGYVGVPDDSKQLDLHCGVCALVSSSGQLLHYKAGNEIEQADCVIRMNEAPAIGFEEHVGRKTTLRVMCFKSIYLVPDKTTLFSDAGNSTLLGWGPPRDMDTAKGKAYRKLERLQASYPELEVYKLTEDRIQYTDRVFETETGLPRKKSGAWLSTGWFTMLVAMDM